MRGLPVLLLVWKASPKGHVFMVPANLVEAEDQAGTDAEQ